MMYFRQANPANTGMKRDTAQIKYIVVHYTAGTKDTARNNVDAFTHLITKTSSHYFVDEVEVAQSVPVDRIAWHCGGKKYPNGAPAPFHGKCTNSNSIGVEMCSRINNRGQYYIPNQTEERTAEFVASIMLQYDIPIERVIRHYDVTGKHCPEPWVRVPDGWKFFLIKVKKYLDNYRPVEKEVDNVENRYQSLNEIPEVLRAEIKEMMDAGVLKGENGRLELTYDMIRCMVISWRIHKLK